MATIYVGSARQDENGKLVNGAAGDQTGKEVCTQAMYTHSKGWYILRPKKVEHAAAIATGMLTACNNSNLGYDQYNRLGIIEHGINTATKTECDCGTLVRQVVKEATGKDPGNFTTANEATMLAATGLFMDKIDYVSQTKTPVYNGDILVTKTKGHTVVVVSGNPRTVLSVKEIAEQVIAGKWGSGVDRKNRLKAAGYDYDTVQAKVNELLKGTSTTKASAYYEKYTGVSVSIDTVFKAIGVPEKYRGNYSKRKPVAVANGISNYTGTVSQNLKLISLAKQGKLKKA